MGSSPIVMAVALTIALWAMAGCSSLRATPPPPELCVRVSALGMSSVQAEMAVARPLEQALQQTPGLVHLRSRTSAEQTEVRLTFATGTAPEGLTAAVRERLNTLQLPASLSPAIERPHDVAIYRYTIESDRLSSSELYSLHDRLIRRPLQMLSGVADVTSCGGAPRRIEIIEDLPRLLSVELAPSEISRAVREALLAVRAPLGGPLVGGMGSALRLSDLQNLPIGQRAGAPLRLGDVASIRSGARSPTCLAGRDKVSQVLFGQVFAQQGVDARTVQAAIETRLQQLAVELPAGVQAQPFAFTPTQSLSRRQTWKQRLMSAATSEPTPRLLHVRLRPVGAPLAAWAAVGAALRELAAGLPSVESVVTQVHLTADFVGKPTASELELFLALRVPTPSDMSPVSLPPLVETLLAGLEKLPGAPFEVELRATDALGSWPAARSPTSVGLRACGSELAPLAQLSQALRASLSGLPAARMLRIEGASQRALLHLQLDRSALALHGIAAAQVSAALATATAGETLGTISEGDEQIEVVARAADGMDSMAALDLIKLKGRNAAWVPLRALATITTATEPTEVLREEGQRCVLLRITALSIDPQELIRQAQAQVRSVQLPPGVVLTWNPTLAP